MGSTAPEARLPRPGACTAPLMRSRGPRLGCRSLVPSTAPLVASTGPRLGCRAPMLPPRPGASTASELRLLPCPGGLHRPELRLPRPGVSTAPLMRSAPRARGSAAVPWWPPPCRWWPPPRPRLGCRALVQLVLWSGPSFGCRAAGALAGPRLAPCLLSRPGRLPWSELRALVPLPVCHRARASRRLWASTGPRFAPRLPLHWRRNGAASWLPPSAPEPRAAGEPPPRPRFAPHPGASTAPLMRATGPSFGCRALVPSIASEARLPLPGAAGAAPPPPRPRLGCRALVHPPRPGALHRAAGGLHGPELRLPRPGALHRARCPPPRRWWPPRARASAAAPRCLHRALVASTSPSFGCRFLAPLALLHRARGSAAAPWCHPPRPGASTGPELRLPVRWRPPPRPRFAPLMPSAAPEICAAPWCRCRCAGAAAALLALHRTRAHPRRGCSRCG